jgi:hypothetical protein
MPRSEYYHLCVRMALTAGHYDERVRLLDTANEYRDMASRADSTVTTPLNDRLRVVTADSILDQGRILHDSPRLRSASRHIAKDCGHRFDGAHAQAEAQRPIAEKIFAAVRAWQLLIFGQARRASPE